MKSPLRILHIEDSKNDAELVEAALAEGGIVCEIVRVEDGPDFLWELKKGGFDLILSDYNLPSYDGDSALTLVKEKCPEVPFIYVSGAMGEDLAIESLKNGATDYVLKQRLSRLALSVTRALREQETYHELKKTQRQMLQQERLRALGEMASGIAHDFNNTLTPVLGYSEICLSDPKILDDKAQLTEFLQLMNTAARDASKVVARLREFYRSPDEKEKFVSIDISWLIQQAISLTKPKWKDQTMAAGLAVAMQTELGKVPPVIGNETELREVLTNLIFNAVDAMPQGGTIAIASRVENKQVVLEIKDTGTGMTEEVRKRCLDPFFTTKGDKGTGLGLSLVYGIIQRHKGTLEVETKLGNGTCFIIRLPAGKLDKKPGPMDAAKQKFQKPLCILYVEDDAAVTNLILKYLKTDNHVVEHATNGREGLQKFVAGRFDLVITDQSIPEMTGDVLAKAIKKIATNKPTILLSGTSDLKKASGNIPEGVTMVLGKPVTLSDLRQAIAKTCA